MGVKQNTVSCHLGLISVRQETFTSCFLLSLANAMHSKKLTLKMTLKYCNYRRQRTSIFKNRKQKCFQT